VARALGFQPDPSARGLVLRRAMAIGIRMGEQRGIPHVRFVIDLLNGAGARAAENGYALVIDASPTPRTHLADGLIFVDPLAATDLVGAVEAGIPSVTIGRVPGGSVDVASVDMDHARSISEVLAHLDEHARADGEAWMISLRTRTSFIEDVETAFRSWCLGRGRVPRLVRPVGSGEDVAAPMTRELERSGPPAMLLAAIDRLAARAAVVLSDLGVAVPEQTVVASAVDGDLLWLARPPITALDLDGESYGRNAADLVLRAIADDETPVESVQLPARLVVRASSQSGR
jgi:DNA-binding LacI/PurR family transcriptional regulator